MDLTSGQVATVRARGDVLGSDDEGYAAAPLVASDGTATTVVTPFLLSVPGTGTQASTALLEVVAVSAEAGAESWRMTVRPPDWAPTSYSRVTASAIGAGEGTVVITVEDDDHAVSYGVDLATHELRWTVPGLRAHAVAGGAVVGMLGHTGTGADAAYSVPAGYDVQTGAQRWQGPKRDLLTMEPAGPSFVRLYGSLGISVRPGMLLRIDTGKAQELPAAVAGLNCAYDGAETLVCSGPFTVAALDARSGRLLWELSDGKDGRTAPTVTTAWHGRVYGRTSNGPVALDARTGKDMPTQPAAAPILVNAYGGLVLTDGKLLSYSAGG
ncbi:PQQ-binding-like beta-propeller repeat protein [Streptomyces sp. NPDC093225]|uniref:outer membrane protein assembly factor BamB family protein n=1 Tax=Streptomyces sp. NPDC093225 TaxID=3366034 RepID=UPI0038018DEE